MWKYLVRFFLGILIGNGALLLLFKLISIIPQQKDTDLISAIIFVYLIVGLLLISFYDRMPSFAQKVMRNLFVIHYKLYLWQEQ